jgi:hypothetical protein
MNGRGGDTCSGQLYTRAGDWRATCVSHCAGPHLRAAREGHKKQNKRGLQ